MPLAQGIEQAVTFGLELAPVRLRDKVQYDSTGSVFSCAMTARGSGVLSAELFKLRVAAVDPQSGRSRPAECTGCLPLRPIQELTGPVDTKQTLPAMGIVLHSTSCPGSDRQ